MIFRLKTSQEADLILKQIKKQTSFSNNIAARLAIALSLKGSKISKEEIEGTYEKLESNGFDFPRHVLLGENEIIYKCLMEEFVQSNLSDAEFFPVHTKFHFERGIKLLELEMKSARTAERLIKEFTRGI